MKTNMIAKLAFHLNDLMEQIDQFPEIRKGINTRQAEMTIQESKILIKQKERVIIEVLGGVASVKENKTDVKIIIIDHDNKEE